MAKIMLVEDDKGLREIYSIRLTAEGYEVVLASDGEEALATAVKEQPDLILSDVMMPKISGFDMLDILRSTPETKDVKVIMMTALSSEDQRTRGENLGANRYLVKSQVGIEDVVNSVHEVLGDKAPEIKTPTTPQQPAVEQKAEEPVSTTETKPVEVEAPKAEAAPATSEPAESKPETEEAPVAENTTPAKPSAEPLEKAEAPKFDIPEPEGTPLNPGVKDVKVSTSEKMEALLNDLDDSSSSTGNTAWPGTAAA